jgi:hypothetical protein
MDRVRRSKLVVIAVTMCLAGTLLVPMLLNRYFWHQLVISNAGTQTLTDVVVHGADSVGSRTWHFGDIPPGESRRRGVHDGDIYTDRLTFRRGEYRWTVEMVGGATPLENITVNLGDAGPIYGSPRVPVNYRPFPLPAPDTSCQGPVLPPD